LLLLVSLCVIAPRADAAQWSPAVPLGAEDRAAMGVDDAGHVVVAAPAARAILAQRIDPSGRSVEAPTTLGLPDGAGFTATAPGAAFLDLVGATTTTGGILALPLCADASQIGPAAPCPGAQHRVAWGRWQTGAPSSMQWVASPAVGDAASLALAARPGGDVALGWTGVAPGAGHQTATIGLTRAAARPTLHRHEAAGQEPRPAVAIMRRGSVLAAWTQSDGIHAAWGARERRIARYAGGGNFLAVGATSDGTALGSWIDQRGRLMLARAREGSRPSAVVVSPRINDYGVAASIATRGDRIAIVWVDLHDHLWARVGRTSGHLSAAHKLGKIAPYAAPITAIDHRGRTHVIASTYSGLWAGQLARSGRLASRQQINPGDDCEPRPLLVSPDGTHIALAATCRTPIISVLDAT
jgi:hypothetical protein